MQEDFILTKPLEAYRNLSSPLVLFSIFNSVYVFVDLLFAIFCGTDVLVVVSICAPIVFIILTSGRCVGIGTNAVMSRYLGSYDVKKANNTLFHGIFGIIVLSILFPFLIVFFAHDLAIFMGYEGNILLFYSYLIPISIASFVVLLTNFLSETIISEGDSRSVTFYIILGNIINLILDFVFVFVFDLGIFGLALATIIGSLLPLIQFIWFYLNNRTKIKLNWDFFKFDFHIFKEIFKISIPSFIDQLIFSILGFVMNIILITYFGATAVVLYTLFNNLQNVIASPTKGGARGLLTISGHLFGARKFDEIKSLLKYGFKLGYKLTIVSCLITVLIFGFGFHFYNELIQTIFHGLIPNEMVILFISILIICFLVPISFICSNIMDGLGKSVYSLICSMILIILIISLSFLFVFYTSYGILGVFIAIVLSEIIISVIYYLTLLWIIKNLEKKHLLNGLSKN